MFLEIKGKPLIPLELGKLYVIGKPINGDERKSNNFIELEEEEDVSQRHCVFETSENAEVFVFDLFSLKGTLLNNKMLSRLEKTCLNNGDIIKVGKNEIKYVHDGNEVSQDSSGFLEVNKNKSGTIASSPDSTSQLDLSGNFLVPTVPLKRLDTSSSSSNRKSDSFTIPETQYCRPRNSLNGSNLSIAESVPDDNDGKIKFTFGNLDSFEGDDDFCIPETQEAAGTSTKRGQCLPSEVRNEFKANSNLEEMPSKAEADGSQFRICTQDYNDGFGEEESAASLHSQIIPLIKHQTVNLNKTKCTNENSIKPSNVSQEEKEMSALKMLNKKVDQENTESRADCPTPDIFDFEGLDDAHQNQHVNIDKTSTAQDSNFLDEDEEDFLLTQALPSALLTMKVVEDKKSFNELEKPCFEIENDRVITSSDKENRCPVKIGPMPDLPGMQLIEVSAARPPMSITSRSDSSVVKSNPTPSTENNCNSLLNIVLDADDLLTQAFLQPSRHSLTPTGSPNKNSQQKCLSSTFLDDKGMEKNPAIFFEEIEKSQLKQTSTSATVFKMPDKDFSVLKKTSSAASATSDSDLDLLMCTPQLITDNLFVGKTEELKKNILAVKNRNLFGDETEEEDDDDQNDLVKLINIPKSSLDFDKLLPHLKKKPERARITEEEEATKEAQKIYKFNICFGKEQDEKQSKASASKSSLLSRDERHAARDKVKESSERKERTKTKDKVSKIKEKEKVLETPARRMTRSKSKCIETPPTAEEEDDLDHIPTQPIVRITRNRTKSKRNESQDSHTTKISSHKNIPDRQKIKTEHIVSSNVNTTKTNHRKRKTDAQNPTVPVKVECKRLKSTHSKESPVSISTSMVDKELLEDLFKNSKGLWNVATNYSDSNILVMDGPGRTFKFLLAMARGIPIVTSEYLKKLNESKSAKEVRISDYLFADEEFEKKFNFSLAKPLEVAKEAKIFKGYEFLLTASILPNPKEIKAIIEASGGHVHDKIPRKPKENQELYLVTSKEDKKDWHKYRRLNKNIIIVSTEAIMSTIMCQKVQMDSNRLA